MTERTGDVSRRVLGRFAGGNSRLRSPGAFPAPHLMQVLLPAMGDPHRRHPSIQITGTNGTGSTAAMTAALPTGRSLRVGLYSSPHLQHPRERIMVDGGVCTDSERAEALECVAGVAAETRVTPGWFEALTAAGRERT